MTDLVVVSLERWDEVWRRNQHLVAGLLRSDPDLRVLFVEPAADPLHDLLARRRPRLGRRLGRIGSSTPGRLWGFGPVKWLPRRIDPGADDRLARAVMRAARRVGMRHPLLWINDPGMVALAERSGWPTLYDVTDDWVAADRPAAELERTAANEARMLAVARQVVVCSPELARRKGGSRPVELIPNAVDVDAYRRPVPRPVDLPAGPVAVYVGTVHPDRLDVDLCAATARALDGTATLVMVGPDLLSPDTAALLTRAGVRLLGPRPRDAVVGYLQHADVLVVPHVVTPFTESLDPIKLYEYQAVGRPVVSTPVAGFREADDARITIAGSDAFVAAVASAVPASSAFPDGAEGPVPSWADRVDRMRAVLARLDDRPVEVLLSVPWSWQVRPPAAGGVGLILRRSDWGLPRWRARLRTSVDAWRFAGAARGARAVVLATAGVGDLIPFLLSRRLRGRRHRAPLIVFDPLVPASPRFARIGRSVLRRVDRFLVIRTADRDMLGTRFGVDPRRVQFIEWPVDTAVLPTEVGDDGFVYSAGWAHRDWTTLIAALELSRLPAILSPGRPLALPRADAHVEVREMPSPQVGRAMSSRARTVAVVLEDTDLPAGPIVLLDAMAMGKAVVTTDAGGSRDYVRDGVDAVVVPPGDPGALAEALLRLDRDPSLRARLGAAARREIRRRCAVETFWRRLIDLSAPPREVEGHLDR